MIISQLVGHPPTGYEICIEKAPLLPSHCGGFFVFGSRISFLVGFSLFSANGLVVSCDFGVFMTAGELRSFYPFILFLTLIFVTSITVCLGVVLYELVLFRFSVLLGPGCLFPYPGQGSQHLGLQIHSLPHAYIFSSEIPKMLMLACLILSQRSLKVPFLFFLLRNSDIHCCLSAC